MNYRNSSLLSNDTIDWKSLFIVLLFFVFIGLTNIHSQSSFNEIEWRAEQEEVVAILSGAMPINASGQRILQRSNRSERHMTADFLMGRLARMNLDVERHQYQMRTIHFLVDLLFYPPKGANIYTEIPATDLDQNEYVILGAHYDSEPGSPGAVDNACGIAMLLTITKEIAQMSVRKRNFIVVFFDQEEDDELGSKAFIKLLEKQRKKIHSVHITDVIGWDDKNTSGIDLQSPTPELAHIYQRLARKMGIPTEITSGASSDNAPFLAAGYPTVGIFAEELTPHIHRPTDTLDTVHFGHLLSTTKLVREVMAELVGRL